uniref:Heat shock cognate 70 kDa protein 2 n=1 Tax=Oliveria decumbens TaxID=2571315 RepID=A0A6B9Q434_9APIA|nr:heat shock cognate 70 kDa protein 2 [Oliveria decumbens]
MVNHSVVKIFTTKMCVSGSGLNLKDTLLNGKKGYIEGTSTKIKNQYILLPYTGSLLVQTISNGCSSGLINNTQDIDTGNDTSILGSLTL